jgi:hypothetical protein
MNKSWLLVALLHAPFASANFKCVDERGVTHFGDVPPAGCANVVMYETSPTGSVLRRIEPTPTPEQVRQRLEEFERRKDSERAAGAQKRNDLALLNSYTSEREVDVARDRNIDPILGRIKAAQDRAAGLDKRLKAIEDEMEFYKAGKSRATRDAGKAREAPPGLMAEQERIHKEKEALAQAVAASEKEIESLRAKYAADKKRWVALKSGEAARPAESVPGDPKGAQPQPRTVHR